MLALHKKSRILFFSAASAYLSALCVEIVLNRRERGETQSTAEKTPQVHFSCKTMITDE
jgi:hypothetical protein